MNPQPIAVPSPDRKRDDAELKAAAKKRAERRSDVLYIAGAALITIGAGMIRIYLAPIAAGCFAMLLPMMEVVTAFVRGVRRK
jgi:hypothetical protein